MTNQSGHHWGGNTQIVKVQDFIRRRFKSRWAAIDVSQNNGFLHARLNQFYHLNHIGGGVGWHGEWRPLFQFSTDDGRVGVGGLSRSIRLG
jgi:hypothetical protein